MDSKSTKSKKAAPVTATSDVPGGAAAMPMEAEIAARTVDNDSDRDTLFHKTFAAGFPYDNGNWDSSGAYDHLANIASTVQDAINLGLRVIGNVEFDGAEPNPQNPEVSTYLRYKAKVVPAHDVSGWTTSPTDVIMAESGDVEPAMKAAEVRNIGQKASDALTDKERGPQRVLDVEAAGAADKNTPVKDS